MITSQVILRVVSGGVSVMSGALSLSDLVTCQKILQEVFVWQSILRGKDLEGWWRLNVKVELKMETRSGCVSAVVAI